MTANFEIPSGRAVTTVTDSNTTPELVPPLAPVPTGTALTSYEPPKKKHWWHRSPPPRRDEFAADANRAAEFVSIMRQRMADVHKNVGAQPPNEPSALFNSFEAAEASAIAALAFVKSRMDTALAAGAAAAVTSPTRQRYADLATTIQALEAERHALLPAVTSRYVDHLAAKAKAEEDQRKAQEAVNKVRSDFKDFHGPARDNLVERMRMLTLTTFGFSCGFADRNDNPPGCDVSIIAAEAVIPSIVHRGSVYFGNRPQGWNGIKSTGATPITNREELENLVDAMMGKPPTDG